MAAEIGLLSLTEVQNFPKSQQIHHQQQTHFIPTSTTGSWMWHPNQAAHEDDSWEVRAFAEDTANAMGTTWPPRSYTCTFCRREFRSAQALGGHMNVHRRDRAQLHQNSPITTLASATTSSLTIPTPELVANGGLCLLYSNPNTNPNPNGFFSPTTMHTHSPSAFLSISPYPMINSLIPPCSPSANFTLSPRSINSSPCHLSNPESSSSTGNDNNQDSTQSKKDFGAIEELDLELRLGRGCV